MYIMKWFEKITESNKNLDSWLDILEKSKCDQDKRFAKKKIKKLFRFKNERL